jgi:predicted methyltransferase MtxX (methanogen marker protein 4)
MIWDKICDVFDIFKSSPKMVKTSNNIFVRKFSGSSVSVGSPFGKILINSVDSKKIAAAVRASIKGEKQTVKLSESTLKNIELAKSK